MAPPLTELPKATSRERYTREVLRTQISWEGIFDHGLRPSSPIATRAASPRPGSPGRIRDRSPLSSPRDRSPLSGSMTGEQSGSLTAVPQLLLFQAAAAHNNQSGRPNSASRVGRTSRTDKSPPVSPRAASYSSPSGGPGRFAFQGDVTDKITASPSVQTDDSSPSGIVAPWARGAEPARHSKKYYRTGSIPEGSVNGTAFSQDSQGSPTVVAPWARDTDRWRQRKNQGSVTAPAESSRSGFSTPTMPIDPLNKSQRPAGDFRPRVPIDFSDTASLESLALSPRGSRSASAPRVEGLGTNIFGRRACRDLQGSRGFWRDLPTYSTCGRFLESTGMDTEFPVHPSVRSRSGSPPGTPSQVSRMTMAENGKSNEPVAAGMRPPSKQTVLVKEQTKSPTRARAVYAEHMNVSMDANIETQHAACLSPRTPRAGYAEKSPRSNTEARALYAEHMNMSLEDSVDTTEHNACLSPKGRARSPGRVDRSPRSQTQARALYSEHMNVVPQARSETEHDACLMSTPPSTYRTTPVDTSSIRSRLQYTDPLSRNTPATPGAESIGSAPALPAWMTLTPSPSATSTPVDSSSVARDALAKLEAWKSSRQGQREKPSASATSKSLQDTPPSTPPQRRPKSESFLPASAYEANRMPQNRRDFHCPLNVEEIGRQKLQPNTSVHPVSPRKSPVPNRGRQQKEGKKSLTKVNGNGRFKEGVLQPNRRAG